MKTLLITLLSYLNRRVVVIMNLSDKILNYSKFSHLCPNFWDDFFELTCSKIGQIHLLLKTSATQQRLRNSYLKFLKVLRLLFLSDESKLLKTFQNVHCTP